jgi:diphthamide synthase (EF-2-diphthine--ammonia ligase)
VIIDRLMALSARHDSLDKNVNRVVGVQICGELGEFSAARCDIWWF